MSVWVMHLSGGTEGANLSVAGVYRDEYVRDPLLVRADDTVTALPFPTDAPKIE
jgi:hypothetical protein